MKKKAAQNPTQIRQRLLEKIREAKFPADFTKFGT
jgi:hypothetical protein